MGLDQLPSNFLLFNDYQSKNLAIIVEIPGIDLLSNIQFFTKIRYGDPDLSYGVGGFDYGGLRPVGSQRNILSLDGGLTISQKLEPEQGRGSISMINLPFIDKDSYMSQVISPGLIIDDILGKEVKIYMGYTQISFPEDYFIIFRGVVTSVSAKAGLVTLQFSDTNVKRKQELFYQATTISTSAIDAVQTTIPVLSTIDFHKKILGPDGTYHPGVKCYLLIDTEYIEYQQTGHEGDGFGTNQFLHVVRGARGTTAAPHALPAIPATSNNVTAAVEIQDHGIDMALQIMMSGWNGPYLSGVQIQNIKDTGDPLLGTIPGAITLPQGVDADQNYGLSAGDYLTISGDANSANNTTVVITGFDDQDGQPNRVIRTNGAALVPSISSAGKLSVRSQFDVYPESCGLRLTGDQVDIATHLQLKDFFLSQAENSYRFFVNAVESSGKSFLESEIYLPMACYSLTKFGRLSMGITKPPLADQRFQILSKDNILNAHELSPARSVNNRKFFNEIQFSYNADDVGNFTTIDSTLDANSLNKINISSVLPIVTKGTRSDLGFAVVKERRTRFFLQRYANAALTLNPKVNWKVGVQIEAGDVLAVVDNGDLQIANFATGERNLGSQLFEVLDRSTDIKNGTVQLQLLGGVSGGINDRYATISPSSLVAVGSSTSVLRIKDSFGRIFSTDERKKWKDYVGLGIIVHDKKWTVVGTSFIGSLNAGDDHALNIDPALSFTPLEDYIVDIASYPANNDPNDQQLYKIVHAFIDPSVLVTGGVSTSSFTTSMGDISKFLVGQFVLVHSSDYSILSGEQRIVNVTGMTITVDASLGFTPSAGLEVELIGFLDGGAPYRFI